MILATCQHETTKPVGKDRKGNQRIRCTLCGKYMVETGPKPLGDMRIGMKDACMALGMLLEGMSIRSVERLTGLHRDTIDSLILVVGDNCHRLLEDKVQHVEAKDVQLDEIWSFIGCKEKTRIARGHSEEVGDSWTFIAIDRDTKLILIRCFLIANKKRS
jgi:transposase-like protein